MYQYVTMDWNVRRKNKTSLFDWELKRFNCKSFHWLKYLGIWYVMIDYYILTVHNHYTSFLGTVSTKDFGLNR